MSVVINEVRRGFYLDSVALMRIARTVAALDGVEEAGLMIGTPANKEILAEAGILSEFGRMAEAGDLVMAIRARDGQTAAAALAEAERLLDAKPAAGGAAQEWRPRSIRSAVEQLPTASLALVSVPGSFAAAEARKAIRRGLDAMIFSDNVPLADEVALKQEARSLGRLVMGPDCGTAIIGGVPLAFANVVPRGDIGIVGASGTGIQEVSCLIARQGGGISHAIGVGGRDLKAEVGGISTLTAIDALDADPATRHVVLISKPPAPEIVALVMARIARSRKPFTVCFIGGTPADLPRNAQATTTLKAAANLALGLPARDDAPMTACRPEAGRSLVRGLYAGGTLAAEAQVLLLEAKLAVASNAPIPGAAAIAESGSGHTILDLGDDAYTRGRPHPMIEPAVRDEPLRQALDDPLVAVVLLDVVLGHGSHRDPAGHLAAFLAKIASPRPLLIASVTGTDGDPQGYRAQTARLAAAGIVVAPSNADATMLAIRSLGVR